MIRQHRVPLGLLVVAALVAVPAAAVVTGFPDPDPRSGRFVNLTRGMASLGPETVSFYMEVPSGATFVLGVFDGDLGGLWDPWIDTSGGPDQAWFTLYADPEFTGSTAIEVARWSGATMPDDDWFSVELKNATSALSENGTYRYNLVASWQTHLSAAEQNNFKVAVEGQIHAPGPGTYGFIGYGPNDPYPVMFPATSYDGTWEFVMAIPGGVSNVDLWNGDFDRIADEHDLNSPGLPPFPVAPGTLVEGAYSGYPPDDGPPPSLVAIPPSVLQRFLAPFGLWVATDDNPSGNQEWEVFRVGTAASEDNDITVPSIPAGRYSWVIEGADGRNTLFIHPEFSLYTDLPGTIGDFVWFDDNGDGQQNDGPYAGIAGVTVELWWDSDGDSVVDALVDTTTTDAQGNYLFENVIPGTYEVRVGAGTLPDGYAPSYDYDGIATAYAAGLDLDVVATNSEVDFGFTIQRPALGQGCTPGYWKQKQHFDSWQNYATGDMFSGVFSVDYAKTLLKALGTGGGQEKALGRHASAALLNSVHPGVNYFYTEVEVIQMVQGAFASGDFETAKDLLEEQNETGCPLN